MKADNLTRAITNAAEYAEIAQMFLAHGCRRNAQHALDDAKAYVRWAEEIIRTRARRAKKGHRS